MSTVRERSISRIVTVLEVRIWEHVISVHESVDLPLGGYTLHADYCAAMGESQGESLRRETNRR